jgi:hypothetical protein
LPKSRALATTSLSSRLRACGVSAAWLNSNSPVDDTVSAAGFCGAGFATGAGLGSAGGGAGLATGGGGGAAGAGAGAGGAAGFSGSVAQPAMSRPAAAAMTTARVLVTGISPYSCAGFKHSRGRRDKPYLEENGSRFFERKPKLA